MAPAIPALQLNCIVCPKRPSFSDVSHLLTHISSKGHLSHYYKLKIHAAHDDESNATLEAYDAWYLNFNVEHLMAERMHVKERKRPKARCAVDPNPRNPASQKALSSMTAASIGNPSLHEGLPTALDLPDSTQSQPLNAQILYKPVLHLWSTTHPKTTRAQPLENPSSSPDEMFFQHEAAPIARMWLNSPSKKCVHEEALPADGAKLKGVLWPGMDIFDAATPEMKRKRNQKKETSVSLQLERRSLLAEPTEMIFTPNGSWRKSRLISGQPDFNSSPDKLTPQISRVKQRRPNRVPLSGKDANASVRAPDSPTPFHGYGPASEHMRKSDEDIIKAESMAECFEDDNFQLANEMRYLNADVQLDQTYGLNNKAVPPATLLDISTGTIYHNDIFAESLEPYQARLFALPCYGYDIFGQTERMAPGIFSPFALPQTQSNTDTQPDIPMHDPSLEEYSKPSKSET